MGVAGLWEVLRPAGQVRSLTELSVEDGFNANPSHQRGFRIGIDASIWFFHAAYGREGENPELRTLFFRCCRLLQLPLLPLFVFDGPNRPAIKRGKRVGGNAHWLTQGMKNIIDAFGFEWLIAPGEAEAELAYLNRVGIIDAVLSDDVDNFLFGATMVIRNPSNTLSGNRAHPVKNAQGKEDGNHVVTYTADAILSDHSVALSRPGTILIGLLSGGDYIPAGLPGCGQKFATGLARAGFGDSLLKAVKELKGVRLDTFLHQWRQDIRNELKTNKSGLLPSKKPSLAATLPDDFPSLPVLMSYVDPLTSENTPQKRKTPPGVWRSDPDPMRIASLCELYFEWGVKDVIVHRFRTVLWPGIVCRAIRRVVVDKDTCRRPALDGARHIDSGAEDDTTVGPSSPTKRISSTLSALALSSPAKKSSASDTSISDPSASEYFTLSSLVPLTSAASRSSSRPASPTSSASRPSPLLLEVLSQRTHVSTDSTPEYRVLVDPTKLVGRAESGVRGLRPPLIGGLFGVDPEDEDDGTPDQDADESGSDGAVERLETAAGAASKSGTKKRKAHRENPTTPLRLWLPACMVHAAAPALAEVYEEKVRAREEKKAKRGARGRRGGHAGTGVNSTSRRTKVKNVADGDDDESVPGPSTSKTTAASKKVTKAVRKGSCGGGRRKPKQASEAQNDAYEFIDLSAGESPCSSNGEDVKENTKGKGKAKAGQTDAARETTKASAKTGTMKGKAATTNTMGEFFNTTKPSTMKGTKSKSSMSRPSAAKASTLNPVASKRIYEEEEEEEDSADVAVPPSLPKSSRPLDLLRAKPKSGTAAPNPTSKPKSKSPAVPRYEEEESSSTSPPFRPSRSKPNALSLPCRPVLPAPQARKKPLFVDVSDTDSDIEVSDVRRQLSGTTGTLAAYDEAEDRTRTGDHDVSVSVGVGKTSTFVSEKNTDRAVGGVIDLIAKGNGSRSKSTPSTSMPTTSLPPVRPVSAPLGTDTIGPMPIARSPSKLAHIFLPRSALESEEEEGSEGDELPTFHRGSAKSRMKKTRAPIDRPAPRPFPMQLASELPVSPCISRDRGRDGSRQDDKNDDGDVVEIMDVFTTPRGPSPPRSPTPSPSPVKLPPAQASAGPATSMKSSGFPTSPTKSKSQADTEPHKKTKQRRRVSSDWDTHASGSEGNGILKSPRKSAVHSSPRHVPLSRGRASSPTPFTSSNSAPHANNVALWISDAEGRDVSDSRQPQLDDSGSTHMGDGVGRKPRPSDASAIYISSGSEDEGNVGLGADNRGDSGEAEANEDQGEGTDLDANGWADTGMILSAPPSPASLPASDLVPTVPAVEVALPNPARASKFKPASCKVDVRALPAECQASVEFTRLKDPTNNGDSDIAVPRPVHRVPLLVARAKRSKGRDDDIIDLTSD